MLNEREKQLIEKYHHFIYQVLGEFGLDDENYYGELAEQLCNLAIEYRNDELSEDMYFYKGLRRLAVKMQSDNSLKKNNHEISCGLIPVINRDINLELITLRVDMEEVIPALNCAFSDKYVKAFVENIMNEVPCSVLTHRLGVTPVYTHTVIRKMLRYLRRPHISSGLEVYLHE